MRLFVALDGAKEFLLGDGPFVTVDEQGVDMNIGIFAHDGVQFLLHRSSVERRMAIEGEHFRDHTPDGRSLVQLPSPV